MGRQLLDGINTQQSTNSLLALCVHTGCQCYKLEDYELVVLVQVDTRRSCRHRHS